MDPNPEKFELTKNDFENCAINAFRSLFSNQEFSDVTLSCTGNKHIKTHKVVLSACSPFFRDILLQNSNPSPLIYLKGIDFQDLEAVVEFMYLGHTSVASSKLESFLASSKELQVEGLQTSNDEEKSIVLGSSFQYDDRQHDDDPTEHTSDNSGIGVINDKSQTSFELPNYDQSGTNDSLTPKLGSSKFKCDQCDFESLYRGNLKRHTEKVHEVLSKVYVDVKSEPIGENIVSLQEAEASSFNNQSFEQTVTNSSKVYKEVFQCDRCEFISKHKWNMKRHKENVHVEHVSQVDETYQE